MNEPYEPEPGWDKLREKVIGLGDTSFRKSYYPQLIQQIEALQAERNKAEENEKKFRTLFEHISDGILLVELDSRAFYLSNAATTQLLGYSQEELGGLLIDDILQVEDIPWVEAQFEMQARGEIKIVRDLPVIRKDAGLTCVDVNATRVNLDGRALLLCVLRDVSERRQAEQALEKAYLETVLALSRMIDARDAYTGNHSQMLATWAKRVAEGLGCSADEIRTIHWAALLHDIGKISVPDGILRKPGSLSAAEWTVMKCHPEIGAEIVAPIKRLKGVAEIIRAHHERYDGNGYPDGLKGDAIPLGGRILSVVDAYSAIIDERVYRSARSPAEALAELRTCAGFQFDPQIVQVLIELLGDESNSSDP